MISENDTIKLYIKHISQYPLITRDTEVILATELKNGDDEARKTLIRSNLRLVVKIAHDFKGRGLPLLDLIAEGNLGLMHAVSKFDPAKGAKLSSYSAWWIKQSMHRALANQGKTIRVPVQSANKMQRIKNALNTLQVTLDRIPTNAEIAQQTNLSERTVSGLKNILTTTVSLNAAVTEDENRSFSDIIPDNINYGHDVVFANSELYNYLRKIIEQFEPREIEILNMRFGLDYDKACTLSEISNVIGITRERIRQIQNRALRKLRKALEPIHKPKYLS